MWRYWNPITCEVLICNVNHVHLRFYLTVLHRNCAWFKELVKVPADTGIMPHIFKPYPPLHVALQAQEDLHRCQFYSKLLVWHSCTIHCLGEAKLLNWRLMLLRSLIKEFKRKKDVQRQYKQLIHVHFCITFVTPSCNLQRLLKFIRFGAQWLPCLGGGINWVPREALFQKNSDWNGQYGPHLNAKSQKMGRERADFAAFQGKQS